MDKNEQTFTDWCKKHKKKLIVVGIGITAVVAVTVGIKHCKALEKSYASVKKLADNVSESICTVKDMPVDELNPVEELGTLTLMTSGKIPHGTEKHLRNLPNGRMASAEKIATAAENGFHLQPHQTWVRGYRTGTTSVA